MNSPPVSMSPSRIGHLLECDGWNGLGVTFVQAILSRLLHGRQCPVPFNGLCIAKGPAAFDLEILPHKLDLALQVLFWELLPCKNARTASLSDRLFVRVTCGFGLMAIATSVLHLCPQNISFPSGFTANAAW